MALEFASWGYVVVASQYRGNGGSEGKDQFGGADVNDVLNLLPLIDSLPLSAPTNLATMAAYRKALRPRDDIEDFCFRDVIPNYDQNKHKELEARSPIKWPGKINRNTPSLIFQGTADWRVSPLDSVDMAAAFLKLKQPFRLVMLEGADHGLTEYVPEVDRITKDWLDWYVRDKKTWPSLEPHGK